VNPSDIYLLIGCEESQVVANAFRKRGFNAYSCDIKPCSGGHPEYHLQMDVFQAIKLRHWHAAIFFPDCTYLTISANTWYKDQPPRKSGVLVGAERREAREQAIKFFMDTHKNETSHIPLVANENPVGVMSTRFRKPDQVIQPWMFGHLEKKATCFWLRGFPLLKPTTNLKKETDALPEKDQQKVFHMSPGSDRAEKRSKTYLGVGDAMADQWGRFILDYYSVDRSDQIARGIESIRQLSLLADLQMESA
jgi:hypothetical protein